MESALLRVQLVSFDDRQWVRLAFRSFSPKHPEAVFVDLTPPNARCLLAAWNREIPGTNWKFKRPGGRPTSISVYESKSITAPASINTKHRALVMFGTNKSAHTLHFDTDSGAAITVYFGDKDVALHALESLTRCVEAISFGETFQHN